MSGGEGGIVACGSGAVVVLVDESPAMAAVRRDVAFFAGPSERTIVLAETHSAPAVTRHVSATLATLVADGVVKNVARTVRFVEDLAAGLRDVVESDDVQAVVLAMDHQGATALGDSQATSSALRELAGRGVSVTMLVPSVIDR